MQVFSTKAGNPMRYPLLTLTLIAAAPVLGGCGSGTPSAPVLPKSGYQKAVQFSACMRAHGIANFPSPRSMGNGNFGIQISSSSSSGGPVPLKFSGPAMKTAQSACAHLLPNGGHPRGSIPPAQREAFIKNAQCMRAHGVPNFPDPNFGGGGGGVEVHLGAAGLKPASPAFQAAMKTCAKLLPFAKLAQGGPVTAAAP
jgi:hypothetical protein